MFRFHSSYSVIRLIGLLVVTFIFQTVRAQSGEDIHWLKSGNAYWQAEEGAIVQYTLPSNEKKIVVPKEKLIPSGQTDTLEIRNFSFTGDQQKILIYTNTERVWRLDTRGDYWLYDMAAQSLRQLGKGRPESSLMFAKFSPNGTKVAYVSEHNLYVEDLASGQVTPLTTDGTRKRINGTFDWVYEEEFFCRDGFRWSPDSQRIAYWQIDATQIKDYLMLNVTDSIYSFPVPVEYPKVGQPPSPYKIGVVDVTSKSTRWTEIPGDPQQNYVPRMEWAASSNELIIQQLNRKQNESTLYAADAATGAVSPLYREKDAAWIDILPSWDQDYANGGWDWLDDGNEFLWASEKDGWRHLYRVRRDGKKETLVTRGNYDVIDIAAVDEKGGYVYFMASPENATQQYLYRTKLTGKGKAERLSPAAQPGTHGYQLSPNGKFAFHQFTSRYVSPVTEWVSLPKHTSLAGKSAVQDAVANADTTDAVEFFTVKTADGVEMDGWMAKPSSFDPKKKYPVVFYVYSEPAGQLVTDRYSVGYNFLYQGNMVDDEYIYIALDNRGTPAPKGRAWRKAIYRKIGVVNIRDQAMAAKEILKRPYVDTSRVAVWGWSGGGSATLNLLFQYPDIYKTGIAVAAVANQLTYDNIYQERYMGLPQENKADFVNGSPVTHAKNLRGNLLYIHGTGDDNVHYQNAEMLINELVKHNKQFQLMAYPNRTHSISEGEGTFEHLQTLYTNFLRQHCPPGGK